MKFITMIVYHTETGTRGGLEFDGAIPLDENDQAPRRTYQVKLTPGEVAFITRLFSGLNRAVTFKLPRWVGQNKRGENV